MAGVKRLPELVQDRLATLGEHGRPLSARAAAARSRGKISHGRINGIANGDVGKLSERVIEGLALAIDVPVSDIYESLSIRRPFEPFTLPAEADRLTRRQRAAVLEVVRSMLDPGAEEPQGRPLRAVARGGQRADAAAADKKAAAARKRQGR